MSKLVIRINNLKWYDERISYIKAAYKEWLAAGFPKNYTEKDLKNIAKDDEKWNKFGDLYETLMKKYNTWGD